jgi:hypothetical protein
MFCISDFKFDGTRLLAAFFGQLILARRICYKVNTLFDTGHLAPNAYDRLGA